MKQRLLIFFALIFFAFSCQDEPADPSTDCDRLINGLANFNTRDVGDEIDFLCEDFLPSASGVDSIGHEANLSAFTRRLSSECGNIEASVLGYATIKTNPPKSEVKLVVFTVDSTFERILDLNTPSDNILSFSALH